MTEHKLIQHSDDGNKPEASSENVFRRGIVETPHEKELTQHRLWLASIQHEYPMPYIPYKIGVYIRFYNQTQYSDEVYLSKHKQWFIDDISLCPKWTLVDFYIDNGARAPYMENAREWCRLLEDCFSGRVNLIVTQKTGNVSDEPQELNFISRILANQNPPVGIYFISEDIYTLASYYREDMDDKVLLPEEWKTLPKDELDMLKLESAAENLLPKKGDGAQKEVTGNAGMDT